MLAKRELLAHMLDWSGGTFLMRALPERDLLLVLNYHRIGSPETDPFDAGLFSATAGELDRQVSWLKRRFRIVSLDEALAFAHGAVTDSNRCCRVLITFDDGYLDNYRLAFPVLRSHGVQGVFFLATGLVGSSCVPWWDHVAYLLKTARRRRFSLRYPADLAVNVDGDGVSKSIRDVLKLYKSPENRDPGRFMRELAEAAGGDDLPPVARRFLNWDEARQMVAAGMAVGSHTHSHAVLTHLTPRQQREELAHSRAVLKEQLGIDAGALAFPVGNTSSFSGRTQRLAMQEGYRAAFSFHGGTNLRGTVQPYDIKRVGVGGQSWCRFRAQAAVSRWTARYWP